MNVLYLLIESSSEGFRVVTSDLRQRRLLTLRDKFRARTQENEYHVTPIFPSITRPTHSSAGCSRDVTAEAGAKISTISARICAPHRSGASADPKPQQADSKDDVPSTYFAQDYDIWAELPWTEERT